MLSYQVLNYYEFIKQELDRFGETLVPLFDWVEEYKNFVTTTSVQILKSSVSSQGTTKIYTIKDGKVKEKYAEIVKNFKSRFLSYTVFNSFGEFKQKITEYRRKNQINQNDYILTLIKETDELFAAYQLFQQDDTEQEKFIKFANKLISYKDLYNNSKIMYADYMGLESDIKSFDKDKKKSVKIQLLDVEYSLKEFSDNLQYIDEAYNEIGNLVYADTCSVSYEKLRIVKIESGSLFSEVFGDKIIIEIFTKILKKSIQWVYGKNENDAELERHTKLTEALRGDAEVLEILEKNGCNVEDSKQILSKALNVISKDMLNLAKSSYNIKVNDEEFKINNYRYRQNLPNVNKKKLNSKNEIEENQGE